MGRAVRPYADAVARYQRAGWRGILPIGNAPRRKSPPPKKYTGWTGIDPSGADIQTWVNGHEGGRNIGLHLPHGVAAVDVDAYNGGDRTLARLEAAVGMPLPPTWTNTARGPDQPSRQYLYRVDLPAGRVWKDHPGGERSGIDMLHVGHRYAVVWPSINPDADNATYFWYDPDGELWEDAPDVGELTVLDPAWVLELSKPGEPLRGEAATDEATRTAVARFRPGADGARGRWCREVTRQFRAEKNRIDAAHDRKTAGGLHNPGKLYALTALGLEGHAGVAEALAEHQALYVPARVKHRGESEGFADADWWRMLRGAVGKRVAEGGLRDRCDCDRPVAPLPEPVARPSAPMVPLATVVTPEEPAAGADEALWPDGWEHAARAAEAALEPYGGPRGEVAVADRPGWPEELMRDEPFWSSRKVLLHIRDSALAAYASPWSTLGVVLARVRAATPPTVQLPALIGGHASLNLFVAVVARSGGGKGASDKAARCVEIDQRLSGASGPMVNFPTHTLGSGEGIAHMFMKRAKPSKANPDPEPYQYNTSALVNVAEVDTLAALQGRQGSTLGGQLRQAAMGEQLGFFYVDKEKRMNVPEHAYRLTLVAGVQPLRAEALLADSAGGTPQRFVWVSATSPVPDRDAMPEMPERMLWKAPPWPVAQVLDGALRTVMPVPEVVREHTVELRRLHLQGEGDPLDGHANLTRIKVAAALAILEGRTGVDEEDWELSGTVMARSAAVRQEVLDELAADRRDRNRATAEAEAYRAVVVTDRVEQEARRRVTEAVRRTLARAADDGWVPQSGLRAAMSGASARGLLPSVLDGMVAEGTVERMEFEYRGRQGLRYRLARPD